MYNREKAIAYARRWALNRNPRYYDFENIGGDCTNYISQCLYAGYGVMNYSSPLGWYYRSISDRAPAWTGVEYLYRFLMNNKGMGPKGAQAEIISLQRGDLIQLYNGERYHHTLIITATAPEILVCAHSYDALDEKLGAYEFKGLRGIKLR